MNQDVNENGFCDLNCDINQDGWPDLNIDMDGDGKADLNIDLEGVKVASLNVDLNHDKLCDLNCDTNGDLIPDLNIDTDYNLVADLNIDYDKDGKADINIDINGDGKPEVNLINRVLNNNGVCDLNCDTNNDGYPDEYIDINNDNICDKVCFEESKIESYVCTYPTYNGLGYKVDQIYSFTGQDGKLKSYNLRIVYRFDSLVLYNDASMKLGLSDSEAIETNFDINQLTKEFKYLISFNYDTNASNQLEAYKKVLEKEGYQCKKEDLR